MRPVGIVFEATGLGTSWVYKDKNYATEQKVFEYKPEETESLLSSTKTHKKVLSLCNPPYPINN